MHVSILLSWFTPVKDSSTSHELVVVDFGFGFRLNRRSKLLGSHLPLRLTENREVGDFVEGNFTVHFQGCFSFFNHDAQSLFAETWILVVDLDHAFVGSRRDFSIDL